MEKNNMGQELSTTTKKPSFFNRNWSTFYKKYSFLVSFLLLLIIANLANPNFFRFSSINTLLVNTTLTGIIAVGMTLVIISGMIDLSVGSIVALVSGLAILVLNNTGSAWLMLIFCLVFGLILGAFNGVLISRGRLAPFIATLATMSAYRSIIVQVGQGGPFIVRSDLIESFRMIAAGQLFDILPYMAIIFVVVAIGASLLLKYTKFGRYVFAVGSNEYASSLAGINVGNTKLVIMSIVGMLSGLSAFLLCSRLTSVTAANAGVNYELDAIAAVAIGGTSMSGGRGRILGSFLGAIMLQMIQGILIAANIPPFLTGLVKGIIIIISVIFQRDDKKK
jgi:ribose transport system permease protein